MAKVRHNKIIKAGDTAILVLGKWSAIIDTADIPLIQQFTWSADRIRRTGKRAVRTQILHRDGPYALRLGRMLTGAGYHERVEYLDRNPFNNRRSNLRTVPRG
jgi:hypothetical protein